MERRSLFPLGLDALLPTTTSEIQWFAVMLSVLLFGFDHMTPRGNAEAMLYTPICLLPYHVGSGRPRLTLPLLASILILLGYFASPGPGSAGWPFFNRALALATMWISVALARGSRRLPSPGGQLTADPGR